MRRTFPASLSASARLAALLAAVLAWSASAAEIPKNIILFIGDGMGPAHFTAARLIRGPEFRIGRMPIVGLVEPQVAEKTITDSAASGSAIATGVKTRYESVSVDPDGQPVETVLEKAEKHGKATGLVTTTAFFDATPASFAAHAKNRHESASIATQMLASGAEIIAGTGLGLFGTGQMPVLSDLAKKNGYALVTTRAELDEADAPKILAVFPDQPNDLDTPEAPLPILAGWAIEHLSRHKEGFFLMVEHEGTDTASHANNSKDVTYSLRSFDTAVGVALDFAARNGDTLVIVTADHETGGLRITESSSGRFRLEWCTMDHTGTAVPIFAYGPGSEQFSGFMDNTDVGKKLLALE